MTATDEPLPSIEDHNESCAGWINLLVFLSGFAALVYEISWTRQLGAIFGQTSQAAAVVLASYFGGMAAGYAFGSRWSLRIPPLRGYAVAELFLGGWAFAVPSLMKLATGSAALSQIESDTPIVSTAARVLLSLAILGPATFAMGATFPFLAAHFAEKSQQSVAATSSAYAWNTLGAFAGIAATIAFLLIRLGVVGSSLAAAIVSILCGIGALLVSRSPRPVQEKDLHLAESSACSPAADDAMAGRATGIAALSGFVTLALEVLYTRLFSLVFHNSTQTFALVIGVFLFGLSLGAFFVSRFGSRIRPENLIRWGFVAGAVSVSLSVTGFVWWTGLDYIPLGPTFSAYLKRSLAHVAAVLLMPATTMGVVLPAAWRVAGSTRLS